MRPANQQYDGARFWTPREILGSSHSEMDHSRFGAANPGRCPISASSFRVFSSNSDRIVILRVCNFIGFTKKSLLKTKSLGGSKIAKSQ
jgi:hypothetical protein